MLAIVSSGANAQNVLQVRLQAQPLVYTEAGKPTGCGIRIVGVVLPAAGQQTFRSFDISANMYARGVALGKVIGQLHTTAEPKIDGQRQVLHGAWFRSDGDDPVAPVGESFAPSQGDKGAYLFQATLSSTADFVLAAAQGRPLLVGIRWDRSVEAIYAGRAELTNEERQQIAACVSQAFK